METIAGRYQIEEDLGKGGMGVVHRATDLRTGDSVALKRIIVKKDHGQSRRPVLRFQREFHTLSSLRHPRIIRAFDYGVDETGPYYTMEMLGGKDLQDVIRSRGPMEPEQVCRLMRDVASALAALHSRGLIHRDLSARNVRVIGDHAVLFDFGVLANAGVVAEVAGTPAYMAPEILRGLPVDGRADLYSLGVLGYCMLAGRKPFEASSMRAVEASWSMPVVPPSAIVPHVPEGLEDLVLDLMCLEPLGRPPSAAVLIDRLTAIGGLDPAPELAVTPGYAGSTAMVGRDEELKTLMELFEEASSGQTRAFVMEAESGVGKTRLLQELGILVKLEGAIVLRVSCEEADGGPFAAMAALMEQAFEEAPQETAMATAAQAPLLGRIFESVRRAHPRVPLAKELGDASEDRMRLQKAIVHTFKTLVEVRPVVLLVDDIQRCDEASAAGLAGLARADLPGLLVGFARRLGEPVRAPAAVASLSALEPRMKLGGLSVAGVKALLRSSFGAAPRLRRLARWMHDTTDGSPLFCTELTRHMVESELIRHDGSSWILPEEVTQIDVPRRLSDAMRRRVEGMSAATRALGEILAVHGNEADLERVLALSDFPDLQLPVDGERAQVVFGALAELVQQDVLNDTGEQVCFRHDSLREALLGGIEPEQRQRMHLHVGEVLLAAGAAEDPATEAEIGWHLYHGGDEERGGEMLERSGRHLYDAQARADCIPPLCAALEVREKSGAPDAVIGELSFMLLSAGWTSNREVGSQHSERPLEIYGDLSGLKTAHRLKRWMGWRLALFFGMTWAALRWLFRRGEARGPNPIRALGQFALALVYATAIAYAANQQDRVQQLVARGEPFRAFEGHPPYSCCLTLLAMTDILAGRIQSAGDRLTETIGLLSRKRFNSLTETEKMLSVGSLRCMRTLVDVGQFNPRLHEDMAAIAATGLTSYLHWMDTVLVMRHRYRGEEIQASALEATLEPTSLMLSSWSVDLYRVLTSYLAYTLTHDLEGLKQSLDALERRVAEGMEFSVHMASARAEIHRERGEYDAALAILEPLLERLGEEEHSHRQWAASGAAQAALESYRYELAARYALFAINDGQDPAVRQLLPWLRSQRVLGLAEDALGRSNEVETRLDQAIEMAEARDCPVLAGELHEARARVAFAAKDRLTFEVHRAKCGEWLRPTKNPGLIAVVERLNELDRLDRERSMPAVDSRRRRPGVSTGESTGSGRSSYPEEPSSEETESLAFLDPAWRPGIAGRPTEAMTSDTGVVMSAVAEAVTADFDSDSDKVDQQADITKASSPRARSLSKIKGSGESSDSE